MILNELYYTLRQPITLLTVIVMPLLGLFFSFNLPSVDYAPEAQLLVLHMTLVQLILPLIVCFLAIIALLRDTTFNMAELINVTQISIKRRWAIRLVSIFTVTLLLFALSLLSASIFYGSEFTANASSILLSLISLLLFVVPTTLLLCATALTLARYSQNSVVFVAVFSVFWLGYLLLASINGSPIMAGSSIISERFYHLFIWADPYGFTAALDNLANGRSILSSELILNRLMYLSASILAIFWQLNCLTTNDNSSTNSDNKIGTKPFITALTFSHDFYFNRLTLELARFQFTAIVTSNLTITILIIWPLIVFNEVLSGLNYAEPLSELIAANSLDALNRITFDVMPLLGAMIIVLWSWQVVKLTKNARFEELTAATSVKNYQLVISQLLTVSLLLSVFCLLAGCAVVLAQLISSSQIEITHYLLALTLTAIPLLLLGSMVLALLHLCKSNLWQLAIITLVLVFKFTPAATALGITHTFWNIAGSPLRLPDNFWQYARSLSVYVPYIFLWVLVSISFVIFAIRFTHRGTQYQSVNTGTNAKLKLASVMSVLITFGYAGTLHWQLTNEKPLYNSHKREAWKASYEKNYAQWKDLQPTLIAINSVVDIYPEQQQVKFQLEYTFENQTTKTIEQLLIGQYPMGVELHIEQAGIKLQKYDQELSQRVYQLDRPLAPKAQQKIKIAFTYHQPQLWPAVMHQIVKQEFTYIRSVPILPFIGFNPEMRLKDTDIRVAYGLDPIEQIAPSALSALAHQRSGATEKKYRWLTLTSQVSTSAHHSIITQGQVIKEWTKAGRNYAIYQTSSPVRAIPAWVSIPYNKLELNSNNTALKVYSPTLKDAAKINLDAMHDTVDWLTTNISPYKYAQLSLVAMPAVSGSGYALPNIMFIEHKVGFLSQPTLTAGFDQRYRRAVHETAHQWFGHDLGNGIAQERVFLVESLAKYIELVLIEKHAGKEAMQALISYERQRLILHNQTSIQQAVPLIDATQSHDQYSRATLVFATLRKELTDQPIINALQTLWKKHAYPNQPATSLDFIKALKEQTSTNQHSLIEQLFLQPDISWLITEPAK